MTEPLRPALATPSTRCTPTSARARTGGMVVALACVCACASTPEPVLIALPAAARGVDAGTEAAAPRPDSPAGKTLLVRRLSIPEYMASRRVRYAAGPARLAEWPNAYWAERVEVGMARELVAALREALPGWRVCDASCGDSPPDVTLKVELLRLDALRREGRLVATAQTQLSLAKPGSTSTTVLPATSQAFKQGLPSDTAQGQALAMTELLRSMADACAAAVSLAGAPAPARGPTP